VEKTYNAVTPEKLRSIRNKISNLNYVYDSTGLHNNVRIIREAQEQLSAWSNLTPGAPADYVDYREREDFLKSNLLTSVEQWKALELMAYTMKKSPHIDYETVKGYLIKEYFSNYFLHMSDVTIDLSSNEIKVHEKKSEPWKITLIDTGENTMTGGRLKRVKDYIDDDFCFTYGDGVGNINITELINFHKKHGKLATVTATQPPGRFGALDLKGEDVGTFIEKPYGERDFINGGFFVLSPDVINLIEDDNTVWEGQPMESLAKKGELKAYLHRDFWQPMDTLRDKKLLEKLWHENNAPWKIW
jgi:glucose-1-phosphate cytidylyltransferase